MVLRVGVLGHEGRASFCLVKNVSPVGVQVKLFGQLASGADVNLRIGDEQPLPGRTIWVRDQLAGIEFHEPLDPAALLRFTRKDAPDRRRSTPRLDTQARAIIRTNGKAYAAELCDVSTSGARLRTAKAIVPGPSLMIALPGLPAIKAYVRWAEGEDLGIIFDMPIPIQIIATWIDERVPLTA